MRIEVSGPGTYTATLDEATLPEEVAIPPDASAEVSTTIEAGRTGNVIFQPQFGEVTSESSADDITLRRVLQLGVEGIKIGLFLALAAIGLSLIYGTTGLVNFAHGEMITFGMLAAYFFNFYGFAGIAGFLKDAPPVLGDGVNLVWATVVATVAGGVLGYLLDALLFRRRCAARASATSPCSCSRSAWRSSSATSTCSSSEAAPAPSATTPRSGPSRSAPWRSPRRTSSRRRRHRGARRGGPAPPAHPDRQGHAGRVRQPRPGRVVGHRRRPGDPVRVDGRRRRWPRLGGVLFARAASRCRFDMGFQLLLLMFAGVTLGGLGTAYGALVGSLVVGMFIQVSTPVHPDRAEERRRAVRPDRRAAGPAPGHPGPRRAGRVRGPDVDWSCILEPALTTAFGARGGRCSRSPPSA